MILRQLAAIRGDDDPATRVGMLVITMELALPMQSHPVQWQASANTGHKEKDHPHAMRRTRLRDKITPQTSAVIDERAPLRQKHDAIDRKKAVNSRTNTLRNTDTDWTDSVGQHGTVNKNTPADEHEASACDVVLCCIRSSTSTGMRVLTRSRG
jgi:hypothetical protein